jgi:hypothetical protein
MTNTYRELVEAALTEAAGMNKEMATALRQLEADGLIVVRRCTDGEMRGYLTDKAPSLHGAMS